MKKLWTSLVGIFGGLLVVLGVGSTPEGVEAALGPPSIQKITNTTPLYLTPAQTTADDANVLAWHYSHSSHYSHESHASHYSHYSHRSGW